MPQNWKTYKLSEIVDSERGISYGIVQPGKNAEDGVPILKVNNLTDKNFNKKNLYRVSQKVEEKYLRTRLRGGELLVSLVGTLGEVYCVSDELIGCNVVRALAVLPVLEEYDPVFVEYCLKSPYIQNQLNQIATTSVQATINLKELREVEIKLPEEKERKAIAAILSALDDKIELNLQMNKTLEEMAMTLYKHWFVDFGPFQNGKFVESELGMIPEGWEVKTIGDTVNIPGGYAFKSKAFTDFGDYVIKIKNINNKVVTAQGSVCIPEEVTESTNEKFIIPVGAYLVAMTGAEVGKTGVVPDYGKRLWLNQRVGMISNPKFENAEVLIGNYLQSDECYQIIQNLAYGSAQPNISSKGLEGIEIILPNDLSIIQEPLSLMKSFDDQKLSNYNENITLTKTRDTLLPKLISGEVRVKQVEQELKNVL